MATTTNGIYYPNDYDSVADIPADMKKIAESVDTKISENKTEIENIKKEQTTQNANISSLEKDNTTNKQDITNIKAKDTEQDKYIAELEAENARLREDLNGLPKGQASGESIDLNDSAEMRCELKISGNSVQDTTPILPTEYEQLDYIESSGTQYIDTNYYPNPKTKVEIDVAMSDTTTAQQGLFRTNTGFVFGIYINSGLKFAYTAQDDTGNFTSTNIAVDNNRHYITLDSNNSVLKIDDSYTSDFSSVTRTKTSTSKLFIFAMSNNTTPFSFAKMKLYRFKISEDDILLKDFIPCIKKSNNEVGLYDIKNNVFYSNSGTENFTYGNILTIPNLEDERIVECCGDNINIFDKDSTNIEKGYLSENGIVVSNSTYRVSDFIKIFNMEKITINGNYGGSERICFYDNNKTFLSYVNMETNTTKTFEVPSKAYYVRTTLHNTVLNSYKLEKGTVVSPYTPYGQGCINEVICNKNIFNKNDVVEDYFVSSSIVSNSSWCYNLSQCFKTGKKYTTSGGRCILSYFNGDTNISYQDITNGIITIPENTTKVYISTLKTNLNILQIEEGSTATPYVEHKSQAYTIPTQQPFRAIGDTRDTFIKKNNKWYERHYIARKIFDGTENWARHTNGCFHSLENLLANALMPTSNTVAALSTCTHFITDSYDNTWKNNVNNTIALASNGTNNPRVRADDFATVDDFKSMLSEQYNAGTPVYVDYILETPLDIECTEEQSTILFDIEQNAKTYKNITHMYSTDEISPVIEVTYKKDIDTMITNIEQAILSQGGNI